MAPSSFAVSALPDRKGPPLSPEGRPGDLVCPNISPRERRKRLLIGLFVFTGAMLALGVMVMLGLERPWRLLLFPLFATAAVCYFEWRDRTCVALAGLGTRKLTDKMEKVEDMRELVRMRRQSVWLMGKAMLVAVPLTLLALLLPR